MIRIRRSHQRGHFRRAWLDARFSFSFGGWRDAESDPFSDLLVLNDDIVAPGGGFAEHGHADVEVMSMPLSGAVEHRDSLGNVAILRPGDVHLMRAGQGIRHSEMNASATQPERHLQWWIRPARTGLAPGYQRIHLDAAGKRNRWRVIAAPEPADSGVLAIAQDARVLLAHLDGGTLVHVPETGRHTYLHVIEGPVSLGSEVLQAGDAVLADDEPHVHLGVSPGATAEVLLFDLR